MANKTNLVLRDLNETDENAFFAGMKDWEGEELDWYTFSWKPGMSYAQMLDILKNETAGIGLLPGRVPHSMLYGFVDGRIVGRVSIRHVLNEQLRRRGGHIGYSVSPQLRRFGYATEMVRQALEHIKTMGYAEANGSVMVTCSDSNVPSWKIIEKFGGKLFDRINDDDGELIRRYWIGEPSAEWLAYHASARAKIQE